MKTRCPVQLLAAVMFGFLAVTPGIAADLVVRKPLKVARMSVTETRLHRVYDCRSGWWQTVKWGKVMPRYAERCYYRVAQR